MTQSADRLAWLFKQYVSGNCTKAEADEFFACAADPANREALDALAAQYQEELEVPAQLPDIDWDYMYDRIVQPAPAPVPVYRRLWPRIAAAASLLLVLSAGAWLLWGGEQHRHIPAQTAQHTVLPGGDRALLTLADGTVIPLDSAANGTLAQQGGVNVTMLDSGRLAYTPTDASAAEVFNTLSTPRGGQFRVILPDGSRVWLNAASSIRYPTVFAGAERRVELNGEAYFEVEGNARQPFKVALNGGGEVAVLGTRFNINAYHDEELQKTTLLQGAVRVSAGDQRLTLQPGEQARMQPGNAGAAISVGPVDVEAAVAWKNGYFEFNQADLKAVMRQVARWYDVEISYEGKVPERKFWGDISRDASITDVLKVLESSRVHFRLEGKKIIVTP